MCICVVFVNAQQKHTNINHINSKPKGDILYIQNTHICTCAIDIHTPHKYIHAGASRECEYHTVGRSCVSSC